MAYTSTSDIESLADELYEASGDDDFRLAELLRQLPKETAVRLCTSNPVSYTHLRAHET